MLPDTGLLYFYEVAKRGSIRHAAEHLHVSASAISRMIKQVEHRFGTPLFERRPDGMVLAPAGEVLARHLAGVFAQIRDAEAEIAELQGVRRGEVSLYCVEAAAQELAPIFLSEFHRAHPGVTFTVHAANTPDIIAALLGYTTDIGITYNMQPHPDIEMIREVKTPLCALVAPSHPLARKRRVSLRDVARYQLAAAEPSFGMRQLVDQALVARGIDTSVLLTTNSLGLLRTMAAEGEVVTLGSRISARSELAAKRLVAVPLVEDDEVEGTLTICKRADRVLSASAQEMIRVIGWNLPAGGL
jgi:DNA-binding transcriptional LysR family regulator